MSRIGKKPVSIPKGVTITVKDSVVTVKGPKGELTQEIDRDITIEITETELIVSRPTEQIRHRAMHGLYRSLIANLVKGVTEGYKKELELDIKSNYIILTNLTNKTVDDIKCIYKKRWEVETHFRFAKKLFKFDSMNTKNIEYVKQNILITQLMFIIEGYIEYILNKKIEKKNKIFIINKE